MDSTGKYSDSDKQIVYDENVDKMLEFIDENTNKLVISEIKYSSQLRTELA